MSETESSDSLTVEQVRQGLKRIGRHPITLQHALLELSLPNAGIGNIDLLSSYPNVMFLDISKNSIKSLEVLSNLPTLVELNARFVSMPRFAYILVV
jgi:Leucine-rich repeat (LRR) protein